MSPSILLHIIRPLLAGLSISLLLSALIQFLHQRLDGGETLRFLTRRTLLWLGGALVVYGLFLLLLGLLGSFVLANALTMLLAGILGYTNFLMFRYREQPLMPRDLIMALNVNRVLTMISPASVAALVLGLGLLGGGAAYLYRALPPAHLALWLRILLGLAGLLLLAGFLTAGREKSPARRLLVRCGADFDTFVQSGDVIKSYDRNGFLAAFCALCGRPLMERPEGYGREAVMAVVERYTRRAEAHNGTLPPGDGRLPHILLIMSEAFSDPTRLSGLEFSEDPLPRIREIMGQTPSGQVLAPGFGGGTAQCEFEALTGFSTGLTGSVSAYENCVNKIPGFPSLAGSLAGQGYEAVALHPYKRGMYARTEAYPNMGFHRFIDVTGMHHTGRPDRSPYVSDAEAYEEALDMLRVSGKPLLLHLVTMQNHGDYTKKDRYRNTIRVGGLPREADRRALETYAQGIRHTDGATAEFLEQLREMEEEVVVLFWGDHLPGVYPPDFVRGRGQELFETPFFFWSNRRLSPEDLGVLSPIMLPQLLRRLAGLPYAPFDALLEELREEVPGIHTRFVLSAVDGPVPPKALGRRGRALLEALKLVQYDTMLGEGHASRAGFFESWKRL